MTMTVEIPDELQSLVAAAVARGRFADEQELVANILRVAVPVLDDYQRLRDDVAKVQPAAILLPIAIRRFVLGFWYGQTVQLFEDRSHQ